MTRGTTDPAAAVSLPPADVGAARRPMSRTRVAVLTLLAMMNAGVYDEAAAWREWLQWRRKAAGRIMVKRLHGVGLEQGMDWLEGRRAVPA